MWDLDIVKNISVISGTSIGTVNGLMFSMDDSNVLESSWANVSYSRFILNEDSIEIKIYLMQLKEYILVRKLQLRLI